MKCNQCGEPLEEDWEYCPECGTTIDFAESKKDQKSREIEVDNNKEMSRTHRIIGIVILCMFGFALWLFLGKAGLYIMCFLVVMGVVIEGLVRPPKSLVSRIIFWICVTCLAVGVVILIIYIIKIGISIWEFFRFCGVC